MKKVAIILSSYNGEKYLSEQLTSLAQQESVELTLFVRDDGSTDQTRELLETADFSFKKQLFFEQNVGFERSFMEAVLKVPSADFDYFAFCDQDDIWDANKLALAITTIDQEAVPGQAILYAANQRIVDEHGHWIRDEADKLNAITKESSLLALNQRGCVMVWNRPLQNHLQASYQLIRGDKLIPAHDTWITVLAYAVGKVYLDSQITMSYRVSTHNTAGSYIGRFDRITYILKKVADVWHKRQNQKMRIAHQLNRYLVQQNLAQTYLDDFLQLESDYGQRLSYLFGKSTYFKGMSIKWRLLSKVLIIIGRI